MAIKFIDKNKLIDNIDKERLEREINILKNTFHYNIISIYQVKENSSTLCIIMEYAEGGELFNYIIEKGCLSEEESRNIFQQIIDAVYYFHQMGICHRDLKLENILFDTKERKRIKIIDFGLSNLYIYSNNKNLKKDLLETSCGSPGYAPPEIILGEKYDGLGTDIWSCGIILYAMLCGCLPYDDIDEEKLYCKIIKGVYNYPDNINISEEAKNLVDSILVVDPKYRININDIKKNKWFSKNYKPIIGLFNSICEIPVNNLILNEMISMGYDKKRIINDIKNNEHNNLTTTYYLLVKKKSKNGIEIENDLISNTFQKYIKEQYIKLQKHNKNIKPISLKLILSQNNNNENNYKYNNNNINSNNIKKNIKKKNKTISKEKKEKKNMNNIKNIPYFNIKNLKLHDLIKAFNTENNKRNKFLKNIAQLSKSEKEVFDKNNIFKNSKTLFVDNISKEKKNMNIKVNSFKNLSKSKKNYKGKIIISKVNRSNNKTMMIDSNKDLNYSNVNKSIGFDLDNKSAYNRYYQIKSKKYNNKKNIKYKVLFDKIYLNKYNNFTTNIKSNIKKNFNINNKENAKDNNYTSININYKIKNLKINYNPKINQIINNIGTSRTIQNKYIMDSSSNSRAKSKSSSNSRARTNSKSKSNPKKRLIIFKASRNDYNKKFSNKNQNENIFSNSTSEKLSKQKNIKTLKNPESNKAPKHNIKEKFKKKESSVHKKFINIAMHNNKFNRIKALGDNKKIKNNFNKMNIFLENKYKNIITKRNNTNSLEAKKSNDNHSVINEPSLNFVNFLKKKGAKNKLRNSYILSNSILSTKNNANKIKILNTLKEKKKENKRNNITDNVFKINDTFSKDISDISNIFFKNKSFKKPNNSKNNHSNNKNIKKKKITIGILKPFKFKNFALFQDIIKQPNTYRKNQKFLDENLFK